MEMHKVPQLCWGQTCIVFAFAACGSKIVSCKTEWHKIETSHLYNRVKFLCACGCAGPVLQCENSMGPYCRKPLEFKIMRSSPLFAIVFLFLTRDQSVGQSVPPRLSVDIAIIILHHLSCHCHKGAGWHVNQSQLLMGFDTVRSWGPRSRLHVKCSGNKNRGLNRNTDMGAYMRPP